MPYLLGDKLRRSVSRARRQLGRESGALGHRSVRRVTHPPATYPVWSVWRRTTMWHRYNARLCSLTVATSYKKFQSRLVRYVVVSLSVYLWSLLVYSDGRIFRLLSQPQRRDMGRRSDIPTRAMADRATAPGPALIRVLKYAYFQRRAAPLRGLSIGYVRRCI